MISINIADLLPFHVKLVTLGTRERVTVYWELPMEHPYVGLVLTVSWAVDITGWS